MSKKNSNVLSLENKLNKYNKFFEIYEYFSSELKKLIKKRSFLVAVSGGSDSLALAALSYIYSKKNSVKIFFVLVDHSIRKNSSIEAKLVKKLLKKEKITLVILKNKKKISKNIQKLARDARYELLGDYCKKKKVKYILTGHHSDDQIETFLIRLSRGSGVQGLSSMRKITKLTNNTRLVRPLLNQKKQDLINLAKISFGKIFKDPSNENQKYLRTRVRNLKKELEKSGLHHDQIIRSINNLASTTDTLNKYTKKLSDICVEKKKKKTLINLKILFLENDEIQLKILSNNIKNLSKSYYPPRSIKVLSLLKKIRFSKKYKATLGGCILEKQDNYLLIKKEAKLLNN
jgi:tRNA(Ile)-lysidine synthase